MLRLTGCLLTALLALTPVALGSKPGLWRLSTSDEFQKGTFRGVALTSDGRLVQAPQISLVFDSGQPFVYSLQADAQGNVLAGTGSEGLLYRLTADGEGSQIADFEEPGVYALAVRPSGEILAGTAPDGKVYRVSQRGSVELFFDPKEKYIWDLALDPAGSLYVATGPEGKIFKVDAQGRGGVFYDSPEEHIVDLNWDAAGRLLAGSSPAGLLLRLDEKGKPFVLFDSEREEVRAISTDRYGNIYAVGISFSPAASADSSKPKVSAASESPKDPVDGETVEIEGVRKGSKLELFRVDRENLTEVLYSADSETVFDILVRQTGEVLLGTGQKGKLLSITSGRLKKVLGETPDEQVTRIVGSGEQITLATSNLGKLYRLSRDEATTGTYESQALDAKVVADWGRIRWDVVNATGSVKFSTRSGNTAKADDTWSEWKPVADRAAGSPITSPPGRYLQWKIDFSGGGDSTALLSERNAVDWVEVSYLQKNVAPRVTSVTVHPPGSAFVKTPASDPLNAVLGGPEGAHLLSLPAPVRSLKKAVTPPPRQIYTPASRSVSWKATDQNGDDLVFDLYLRGERDAGWRLLEENRRETFYTLDGASVPDGHYSFRIVVSDRLSNPPQQALETETISKSFTVANRPPTVAFGDPRVSEGAVEVEVTVRSGPGPVFQLEYSLDGAPWMISWPVDGIADSEEESYLIRIENASRGTHSLLIRVFDSVGNPGTGQVDLKIP